MTTPLLTNQQVIGLPNTVLHDPVTGHAAAYNGVHRLITGHASAALVAYAKAKRHKETPWDENQHNPDGPWYAMPDWATAQVRARSTLYWVRSGKETQQELQGIPHPTSAP